MHESQANVKQTGTEKSTGGKISQIVAAILQKHPYWFPSSVPHQPRVVLASTDVCKRCGNGSAGQSDVTHA
jgi:hypothetical protein